ncbi:4-diphosphocytidyl-2C-methyl-D-erythritol kinase [Polymorphobacter arshaanensis]|uniref:4-diphosphocytidyl-2C-methyl-D-erythritol kinase n=1 Tax=Glacieibacterium arshaanense TaxID=2511025 RepID=A0A4Y9ENY0_9SPHN|nr:molybdopterin-binding/glycosyltransferase family 2 protein [Polymorphobacter arshaanensis]TFU03563.1 4-diphosphocytidyl-2C-methyl-D-erythritol kinase [Polymorphobacter arshaanensis]
MIFGPLAVADCEGAVLAHSLLVDGKRWAKGRVLSAADCDALRAAGLAEVTVARFEPGEVAEDAAATRLATALAGRGVTALAPVHGRVNLIADVDGLLAAPRAAVDALNAVDEALTLGTLADFARVAQGDIIATIKIIPYAVREAALEAALAAVVPIRVAAFQCLGVDLFQTTLPGTADKLLARTDTVTRGRIAGCHGHVVTAENCAHDTSRLATLLRRPTDAAITLVAGASATVDRGDVIPAAIVAAGGIVERLGMPVDPGNLLVLGRIGSRAVIGLPGCARSPKRNGFDWVLERLFAGIPVTATDIAAMGSGGLLAETERPEPRARHAPALAPIGAVLLAAGRSTRMGSFKLLEDLNGRPLVAHAAQALIDAGLPVFVVLGHEAAAVRAALAGLPVQFIVAADYARGMSHSLRAGLAAIPGDWRGVLVALGDMPRVSAATVAAITAAATSERSIVVPVHDGRRGNPVLFGRAWLARLSDSSGDRGGKALLDEFADLVTEVEVADDGVLFDIDDPATLAAARKG